MRLHRLHHRLAVGMALAALAALAGGAGLQPVVVLLAALGLVLALFWQPEEAVGRVLNRVFAVAALLLVIRAGYLVAFRSDDRLLPMVDLLLLLLVAEALKPLERVNDVRLYILSFALLLASTVYRPGLLFGVAFVVYVALSTLTLMVGHLRRKTRRYGVRDLAIGRRFLLGTGALSVVTLAVSAVLFLAFPRVSRGWMPGGRGFATSIAGFSDEVSLGAHGATIRSNPQIVLRVEFPDGPPGNPGGLHWRGRSYDRFDGVRWTRSDDLPNSAPGPDWYRRRWAGTPVRQEIFASLLDTRVLFGLHPVLDVRARSRIRPVMDAAGDLRFFGNVPPRYVVESYADGPGPDALRAAPSRRAPASRYYLQLPALSPRVFELADSLTAGVDTRYDHVRAVEAWLRGFAYTRELPATAREATLEHFLFERQAGHCEYFSTAMAVLLRAVGIPARNVNGFLGGEWNGVGDYLAVTQNQAHSWVEVWFPDHGWIAFDPTPSGDAAVAGGALLWFWPGRFLLDGLQHRWNKWVLEYSLSDQLRILRTTSGLFDGGARPSDDESNGGLPGWLAWSLAAVGAAAVVWVLATARPRRARPETRLYLGLRRLYARAGFDPGPAGAPLRFIRGLGRVNAPGAAAATSLVNRYLEARFGGVPLAEDDVQAMKQELQEVRQALRASR